VADLEIEIMALVVAALDKLDSDHDSRARVLRWAVERYGVSLPTGPEPALLRAAPPEVPDFDAHFQSQANQRTDLRDVLPEPSFEGFVDLLDAVDPKSHVDKALTAAYWLQVINNQPSWQSLGLTNLLKDTGHWIANMTSTLGSAQDRRPALVSRVHKSGRAAVSWKTYRLTAFGVSYIRHKLGQTDIR
jgi:hypothetical protein